MRKPLIWAGILIIGLLLLLKFLFFPSQNNPVPGGKGGNLASNVTVKVLQTGTFEDRVLSSGSILANEEVELAAEASGRIQQLLFKEGDKVNKGELLVKLNDAELVAQLKKLQLQLQLASDKESRQKKLLDIKGISQEEYDAALNQLNSIKADIDITSAQIGKTEIRAPFSGIIGLKSVSEGSYVSPSVKVASIQQTDPVKIDFSLPEKYAGLVKKGSLIRFSVQGQSENFEGMVYAIEPKIDPATRSLKLRASCPNKEGQLLPGAFARIELVLHSNEAIMVPTEAVMPELKGKKVYLYKSGKAEAAMIETGERTEKEIEVVAGLKAGDTVIVTGIMGIRPGGSVKIVH